jgi:hypothetical protein
MKVRLDKARWDEAFENDAFTAMLDIPETMDDVQNKWVRKFPMSVVNETSWGLWIKMTSPETQLAQDYSARVIMAMVKFSEVMAEELRKMVKSGDTAIDALEEL